MRLAAIGLVLALCGAAQAETAQFDAVAWEAGGAFDLQPGMTGLSVPGSGWMADDVPLAWGQGYTGQGTTVVTVDDFTSGIGLAGDFGFGPQRLTHGQWVATQVAMIAPDGRLSRHDYMSGRAVGLGDGFTAINLSYEMKAPSGYDASDVDWDAQERSIISYAHSGVALVVKAAGNDAVEIGQSNSEGLTDYLGVSLIGGRSVIFAGALQRNGSPIRPARLASYSNMPGRNPVAQSQFLVVGVDSHQTGLFGTSFAAPVIASYGAVVASKYPDASPSLVADHLLATARRDWIANYDVTRHGMGEACLSCALAPLRIE